MVEITTAQIETALQGYRPFGLKQDLLSQDTLNNAHIDGNNVVLEIELGFPMASQREALITAIQKRLSTIAGIGDITVKLQSSIRPHSVQQGIKLLSDVKNTIAIASGKGGVGKSTTAVNLALALQAEGSTVGILDADIYGPSQPTMLGCHGKPETVNGKSLQPKISHHLQTMSIGYLVDTDTPMIWRGPMVTSALEQLLTDTRWSDLDYLIIDLPPGTGDIQLTLCQKIPLSAAIIVTTPQDIALLDARRGLKMFAKVNVPVLGIIENMSTYICAQCGYEEHIFGSGGGERMAQQYEVDLLGALPLDKGIRQALDEGKPTVVAEPDSAISQRYREIAIGAAARLSLRAKDYSNKFPKIVIENN